jgi:hypothetical protein
MSTPHDSQPLVTAIFITPDDFETTRRTVVAWSKQTIASRVEAIVVAPSAAALREDTQLLSTFHGMQVLEHGPARSTAAMRAQGIRAARAPFVAITEDHCYPSRRLAELALKKFAEGHDVVAAPFRNANPSLAMSWANLLIEYAPWVDPPPPGEPTHLPGHNGLYRRDVLLSYGEELESIFEAETVLQWDMASRHGSTLALLEGARMHHLNFSKIPASLWLRFLGGLLFAGNRAREWGWGKRLAYAAGSPLIPLVRFRRIAGAIHRVKPASRVRGLRALVLLALAFDALGELAGYLGAPSDKAMDLLTGIEFKRERFMADRIPPRLERALARP